MACKYGRTKSGKCSKSRKSGLSGASAKPACLKRGKHNKCLKRAKR